MKALFLDVDGVLNTSNLLSSFFISDKRSDPVCLDRLAMVKRIVDSTGCVVVLSSSWRLTDTLRNRITTEAANAGVKIYDITPDLPTEDRDIEILTWCELNSVKTYAILDDLSLPDPNLFQTTMLDGLTNKIADSIIKHLGD